MVRESLHSFNCESLHTAENDVMTMVSNNKNIPTVYNGHISQKNKQVSTDNLFFLAGDHTIMLVMMP